jgi:hypothetical protein
MGEKPTEEQTKAVFKALENESYEWRTIEGVAKETGFSFDIVLSVIEENRGEIISSSSFTPDGKRLYTTRNHYLKNAPLGDRFLGALKNRMKV